MVQRIDTHQHFWHYNPEEYGWMDDRMAAIRQDFLPADAKREMNAAGVDLSVVVQVRQSLQETRWLLSLADAHPFIVGVVGWVDLRSPDLDADLDALVANPALVGLRHIVQDEPEGFLAEPAVRRGLATLEARDLPFDLLVYARQLPAAVEVIGGHPGLRVVLDHLGKPDIAGGRYEEWRPEFDRMAALPNVWCKLSGLVTEADWRSWTPGGLRPYLDAAFEAFGPRRLMVGSDWPVCTLAASYGDTMGVVFDALAEYSDDERARVLGGTAREFWKLLERST
jgi:L-fuconolactonase